MLQVVVVWRKSGSDLNTAIEIAFVLIGMIEVVCQRLIPEVGAMIKILYVAMWMALIAAESQRLENHFIRGEE
jgi:hypothetical protein